MDDRGTNVFRADIAALTASNDDFRRVLVTGRHSQIVLMALPPGVGAGRELHADTDLTVVIVRGRGRATVAGRDLDLTAGTLVFVPAGALHDFVNVGREALKLYAVYAPEQHAPGVVHRTKADEMAVES